MVKSEYAFQKNPLWCGKIFMVISFYLMIQYLAKRYKTLLVLQAWQRQSFSNGSIIIWLTESMCVCAHLLQNSHIKTTMHFQQPSMWHAFEFSMVSIWGTLVGGLVMALSLAETARSTHHPQEIGQEE